VDAWTVITESTFDRPMTYEAPMPVVPPAGQRGTLLSTTHYRVADWNDRLRWQQRLWVDRLETVQVPAGRFDSVRIVRVIAFQHADTFRLGSERVDTLWYAPAVKRWVLRDWRGDFMPGAPTHRFGRFEDDRVAYRLLDYRLGAG
jgi:hypothetical protein